jgi:dipeptidase D
MSKTILDLEPKEVWENFYALTQIPRPSKHEDKIQEFMVGFGQSLGLETIKDETGNVIIKKPATPGMENRMGVVLQGHLDMVPQKNNDKVHDFTTDPISTIIDGDWVRADNTTLGSDNGIGVASAMAVLASTELVHGPVEALFTCDEETGMTGANELKPGLLSGDILLNLDSEDEGELYIGCAGGIDSTGVFSPSFEDVPVGTISFNLTVKGLKGGHSGLDINLGRGNANIVLNALLKHSAVKYGIRLSNINGGNLRNAIPREAFAVITLPAENEQNFVKFVNEFNAIVTEEYSKTDEGVAVTCEITETPDKVIDLKTQRGLFEAVSTCPNGTIAMTADMPDVVETSSNLAIVRLKEDKIEIAALSRSSVDAAKTLLASQICSVFTNAGAVAASSGEYPGWKPNVNSPILKAMKEVYNNKFGKVPEVKVIHAGLECGILAGAYPQLDMISFGPTIRHPHSPAEKVNIKTVGLFWEYLVETLKEIPIKE